MKYFLSLPALACVAVLFSLGCGGGGGGNGGGGGGTKSFTGIYSGTTKSTSGGHGANLTVQITQTGANTNGTDLLDSGGEIVTGTSTGTVTGSTASVDTVYGGKFGTATVMFTKTGNTLNGTYTTKVNGVVADTGTVTLTLSNIATTSNAAGNYDGTSTNTGAPAQSLAFTVAQSGDTITISNGLSKGTNAFTGAGLIIGNTFGAVISQTGSSNTIDIIGTLNGTTLSGTTWEPGTNSGNNGTPVTGVFNVSTVHAQ
jgi:hypothetical protein